MNKTLTILATSTALAVASGVPAWSAMQSRDDGDIRPVAAIVEEGRQAMPLVRASGNDDEDEHRDRDRSRRNDDDDCDDDDDHDDDDVCGGSARNSAPAGAVAPLQNGLSGTGVAPRVKVDLSLLRRRGRNCCAARQIAVSSLPKRFFLMKSPLAPLAFTTTQVNRCPAPGR